MVDMDGKLVQVIKSVHGAGQGRQLGNVQASLFLSSGKLQTFSRHLCRHCCKALKLRIHTHCRYAQMELRDIKTKRKYNVRFRTSDMVERVQLETKDFQVLYVQGDTQKATSLSREQKAAWNNLINEYACFLCAGNVVHLMDDNYEQFEVDKQIFGDQSRWLIDGLDVTVDILQNGELVTGKILQTPPS